MILLLILSYDFRLTDLNDSTILFSELYKENPVLVSFWATWCKPCKKELKYIQEFYEDYSDSGIFIITITVDDVRMKDKIESYIKGKNYSFPVFFDTEKNILKSLGLSSIPATLIFDKKGEIIYKHIGYKKGDEEEIEEEIKKIIRSEKDE